MSFVFVSCNLDLELDQSAAFLIHLQGAGLCFKLIYCRFSLGVKGVVKTKSHSFRDTSSHQRLLVITGASWEQLGEDNDWLQTMKLEGNTKDTPTA